MEFDLNSMFAQFQFCFLVCDYLWQHKIQPWLSFEFRLCLLLKDTTVLTCKKNVNFKHFLVVEFFFSL